MLRVWALGAMLFLTAAPAAAQVAPRVVDRFRQMDALRHAPDAYLERFPVIPGIRYRGFTRLDR